MEILSSLEMSNGGVEVAIDLNTSVGHANVFARPPFKILFVVTRRVDGERGLVRRLRAEQDLDLVLTTPSEALNTSEFLYDVLLVDFGEEDYKPLAWALSMRRLIGCPELVFVADDPGAPICIGVREVGLRNIIASSSAAAWLHGAVPMLASITRSRRVLQSARAALRQAVPLPEFWDDFTPRPLFEAEGQFRESYVRALLACTNSRREAAMVAGLSYRTFCQILSKLGLSGVSSGSASESVERRSRQ